MAQREGFRDVGVGEEDGNQVPILSRGHSSRRSPEGQRKEEWVKDREKSEGRKSGNKDSVGLLWTLPL